MKIYVGITDSDWFRQLKADNAPEVNFWQPGGNSLFKALQPNELFLFKQHKREGGRICGGGFFVRSDRMPSDLAWQGFGEKNGSRSFTEMRARILQYRKANNGDVSKPNIGCIILTQPFYFDENDYIDAPSDWANAIVSGKAYDTAQEIGAALFAQVQERLARLNASSLLPSDSSEPPPQHDLGDGAFRLLVADAYDGSCAMTGEHTLPALVASHIMPPFDGGKNIASNGLLLRADLSALFSRGLLTVNADDLRVNVSPQIRERYSNGLNYYLLEGHPISLPKIEGDCPDRDLLAWHNKEIFAA